MGIKFKKIKEVRFQVELEPDDYTKVGDYFIHWDGFDDNDIYDRTRFNGKKLKAKIGTKGYKQKNVTIDFCIKYSEVDLTM